MENINTPEEILDTTIVWEIFQKRHPETAKNILIAMQEFGKQQYNQAVMDCIENATADVEFYGWGKECQLDASEYGVVINKNSMLKLVKE